MPDVVARRRRSYELLALRPGDLVADVGCGLGTAARELAALGARAIGFDASEAMVADARQRSDGLSIEFAIADVNALPLQDGALAGYRAERLYQHLADPSPALAEACRVLAPGGHLVLVDQDWDAFLIDGDPKDVTRAVLLGFSDSIRNGWVGRSYHRLLTSTGFADVAIHPETVAITTPEQGQRLLMLRGRCCFGVAARLDMVAPEGLTQRERNRREDRRLLDLREGQLRPSIEVFVLVSVRLYRDGIADAVGRDPRFRVVGSAATFDDARMQLSALGRPPDAALVDLGLAEGAEAVRALRDSWPATSVVALWVREVDRDVVSLAEAGVSGFVSRDATLPELLDAVEAAARDEALCSPAVTTVLLRRVASLAGRPAPGDGPALTRREREIVRLIGDGLSNKEIAGSLRIELPTVKNHVHNILEKLRVQRRTDAVAAALTRGELNRI